MDANTKLRYDLNAEIGRRPLKKLELASKVGMSSSSLSNILTGRKRLLTQAAERLLNELNLQLTVTTKDPAPNPSEANDELS